MIALRDSLYTKTSHATIRNRSVVAARGSRPVDVHLPGAWHQEVRGAIEPPGCALARGAAWSRHRAALHCRAQVPRSASHRDRPARSHVRHAELRPVPALAAPARHRLLAAPARPCSQSAMLRARMRSWLRAGTRSPPSRRVRRRNQASAIDGSCHVTSATNEVKVLPRWAREDWHAA